MNRSHAFQREFLRSPWVCYKWILCAYVSCKYLYITYLPVYWLTVGYMKTKSNGNDILLVTAKGSHVNGLHFMLKRCRVSQRERYWHVERNASPFSKEAQIHATLSASESTQVFPLCTQELLASRAILTRRRDNIE